MRAVTLLHGNAWLKSRRTGVSMRHIAVVDQGKF